MSVVNEVLTHSRLNLDAKHLWYLDQGRRHNAVQLHALSKSRFRWSSRGIAKNLEFLTFLLFFSSFDLLSLPAHCLSSVLAVRAEHQRS